MKEISPLLVIIEMMKKDITMTENYILLNELGRFKLRPLSFVKCFDEHYNTLIGAISGGYLSISFGWTCKSIVVLLIFCNDSDYKVKIQTKNDDTVLDTLYEINAKDLNKDDILPLTLEYGISKIELSDELYEFIFGG